MKTKFFTFFVALFATTCLWAYDFKSGDLYYNITSNVEPYTVELTRDGEYELTSVTIPSTVYYNGITYSVTNIGTLAFGGCSSLTSVTIENGLTSIGKAAFSNCSSLTSITIPNSVTSIEGSAFNDCTSLTSVTIPNSVTNIGVRAFENCESLSSINIPESVINIGYSAFANSALYNDDSNWENDELYIDNCLIAIKSETKSGDYSIKDGVRLIAGEVFRSQNSITSVIIPNSVKSISTRAFYGMNITSIVIPNNVKNIEQMAFYSCSSLTDVTLGSGITSIEEGLFVYCYSLTHINIPEGVKKIGKQAFKSCEALEYIVLSSTIPPTLDTTAFDNAPKPICCIPCGTLAAYLSSDWNNIADSFVELCNQVKMFYTSSDSNIVVPYNSDAFGAKILNNSYEDGQGVITFLSPISQIGNNAFYNCSSLTSITIPESVTKICGGAFQDCSSLTELSIPSNCVFEGIWEDDGSLQYWGYTIIVGCHNLKKLIVPASLFDMHEEDYPYVKSNYLPYCPEQLETLIINSGELSRLGWDFIERNNKTLKTIDLGGTTSAAIAEKAFYDCYKLENLSLPSQLEHIPYMAVAECIRLKSIEIPATVTEIEDRAFENCRMLSSVNFAKDGALTRIGNWAFYNNHELTNLVIPEGVTEVGHAAFYGCTYLAEMTLPSTVQEIADNGFALCAKLRRMNVDAMLPPTVAARTFEEVDRSIPVYVPDEVVDIYKAAPVWQEFNIQGKSNAPTGVENTYSPSPISNCQKVIHNGQLLILRDGKMYSIMGQEM